MSFTITSSLFGEVDYTADEVYSFETGLPGFPEHKQFLLLKIEDSPFTVLHAIDEDLYFILLDPFSFFSDYEFALPEHVIHQLSIEQREHVACYSIVVLRDPLHDSTANMAAPVVLNTANRKGMQLVLEKTPYSVKQPVFAVDSQEKIRCLY
ncbi:flagellar assembly factor FliW [Aneurinibacillus soli]|uniref:Flagellar assembly factor FliW n=1 Tax=Aneurinibacillus soli TaxID=1500254 RepID=A0A0U5B004_9BACL|nr:flagellar assembly protein FliW [Aneurinibacillus soli]PYE61486.1 flagellar assembly factor FliW [Aneurinibacillus soli]BAU26559.1 Flagellar assembly factor FliW [Aneurinibacillus soli]